MKHKIDEEEWSKAGPFRLWVVSNGLFGGRNAVNGNVTLSGMYGTEIVFKSV